MRTEAQSCESVHVWFVCVDAQVKGGNANCPVTSFIAGWVDVYICVCVCVRVCVCAVRTFAPPPPLLSPQKHTHTHTPLSLVEPRGYAEPQPELGSSFCFSTSGAKKK